MTDAAFALLQLAGQNTPPLLRVMVVDRNAALLDLLAALLEYHGCSVACVASADRALAMVTEFRPHAVCSGIVLDDSDGFTLATRLRTLPETASSLLMAVSGRHHPDDQSAAREAGFDHFIVKPFMLEDVMAPLIALRQTLTPSG